MFIFVCPICVILPSIAIFPFEPVSLPVECLITHGRDQATSATGKWHTNTYILDKDGHFVVHHPTDPTWYIFHFLSLLWVQVLHNFPWEHIRKHIQTPEREATHIPKDSIQVTLINEGLLWLFIGIEKLRRDYTTRNPTHCPNHLQLYQGTTSKMVNGLALI